MDRATESTGLQSSGREEERGSGAPHLDFLSSSKGDFVDPCLGDLILILKIPQWLKTLLSFLLKPLVRAPGIQGRSLWALSYDCLWSLALPSSPGL